MSRVLLLALAFLCAGSVWGQESRGSIAGIVRDQQGASVAGSTVVVTNTETNAANRTSTNSNGYFEVSFLNPGAYTLSVEATGFRKILRSGLVLNVGSRLDLEFQLEIGQVAEAVEVTAEAPILDTASVGGGRVLDQRQILQLPIADMNPFTLAAIAPGMQWTGNPGFRRPSDVGGTSSFNTMGGVGQNEYTMDGSPVTGTRRRVGFVPPSDSVAEFKLETTNFDAAYGHSTGAAINVATRAGTNVYHGTLYDQHWQQRWNATPHFTRLQFEDAVRRGQRSPDDQKQNSGRSNFLGGNLGGPVRIPKLFNGKDKLFFFLSYNGHFERTWDADSPNRTVPNPAWRNGDFSDLLAVDPVRYTIYDPRSAQMVNGRVVRTPFPGNRGVPVLNPLYDYYASIYPQPNNVPGLVSPEGFNNFFADRTVNTLKYNAIVNRFDYNLSDRHRFNGRWQYSRRTPNTRDWAYDTKPGLLNDGSHRVNKGGAGNYVWVLTNNTLLDFNASWARFADGGRADLRNAIKPSDVGLPAYMDAKAGDYFTLPTIQFSELETLSTTYQKLTAAGTIGEFRFGVTSLKGSHSLKFGFTERRYWYASSDPGYSSGVFTFNNAYTRQADDTNTAGQHGHEWAAFRMGLPSAVSIDTVDSAYWSTRVRSLYAQDDWRLSRRVRLNFGLRYERESGITERFNRGLSGEFLADAKLPFSDIAQSVYARNPIPELPASQFRVLGGTSYLGQLNDTFTNGTHRFLPRAGIVAELNDRTVLRAGYGWYFDTLNANNTQPNQHGYSLPTTTVISTDNGLSFTGVGPAANLSPSSNLMLDPFPVRADGTRFNTPYGNQLGVAARAGSSHTFYARDYAPAFQQRWKLGIQRQLMKDLVVEASYNGAFSRIPVNQPINVLPAQYWATGNVRNSARDTDLNTNLPNPFRVTNMPSLATSDPVLYQYMSSVSFFTSANIRKNQLLRPYPHMTTLTGVRPGESFDDTRGRLWYNDLQLMLERRFNRGFQSSVMYTYTTSAVQDTYLNEFDAAPTWQPNANTRPHRFVWTAIWELPFGKGRTWLQNNPIQHVIGGWQLSWVYQYQSGPPTNWGNRFFYGDMANLEQLFNSSEVHERDIHLWFDPSIAYRGTGAIPAGFQGFEGRSANQPGQFHVRTFPARLDVLRADGIRNWDVKILRKFQVTEGLSTSLSLDMLNATNHTNFSPPNTDPSNTNFGRVTSQNGLSRRLQLNLRIDF